MNSAQIRCFLTVADTLNFARAAEQLHVTQPAVTHQLQTLEEELGVKLFHRTTRTVRLTEAGGLFLADARQMAALEQRALHRFARGGAAQWLALGCLNGLTLALLAAPLAALRAQHPALHPRLEVIPFRHIYQQLEEGDLDAVLDLRAPDAPAGRFRYRELAQLPLYALCAPGSPLAGCAQLAAAQLAAEPLVLLAPHAAPPALRRVQETLLGDHAPDALHICDSTEALTALSAAGYGTAVLPLLPGAAPPGLARVPLAGVQALSFGAYYKTLRDRPLLKEFLACPFAPPLPEKEALNHDDP